MPPFPHGGGGGLTHGVTVNHISHHYYALESFRHHLKMKDVVMTCYKLKATLAKKGYVDIQVYRVAPKKRNS